MDGYNVSMCIALGIVIGMILSGWAFDWGGYHYAKELGQSICEEEYGMDFESYYNEVLKCKPILEHYDGIKVQIPITNGR